MDTKSKICHDLKTERPDVAPPLPAVASALPIAFYLACVGAVGLNLMFYMKTKDANEQRDEFKRAEASEVRLKGEIVGKTASLKKEETRANDVLGWVDGSRSFQPVIVAIAKSVDTKGSVVELGLTRDGSDPKQIRLSIKFEGLTNDRSQIEIMEESLQMIGYRTYNAQQIKGQGKGSLSYDATLLWSQTGPTLTANTTNNE